MSKDIFFKAPGKTFLFGEYFVLYSGKAILVSTPPLFSLQISPFVFQNVSDSIDILSVGNNSPIGKYWQDILISNPSFMHVNSVIKEKSKGKGFGSSSAYMLFAMVYENWCKYHVLPVLNDDFFIKIFSLYAGFNKFFSKNKLFSGADFASQYYGYMSITSLKEGKVDVKRWPFDDLGMVLLRTGKSLVTHLHLDNLTFVSEKFADSFIHAETALYDEDSQEFVRACLEYQKNLIDQDLQAIWTTNYILSLSKLPGFKASKGCGALGAEVIVVFYDVNFEVEFLKELKKIPLEKVSTHKDICPGLKFELI